jgi:sugar lactone lactonase YvrE
MTRRLAIVASILLAGTAGVALAAPSPARVSELVGPSAFHGIHGIAVAPNGKLLVGSVVGQAIYEIDPVTGANHELIGPPNGMADDIAFAPDGTMAWTAFLLGKVFAQKPGGPLVEVAKGLPGTNSLAFSADGHFYFSQVFAGDALWEADVTGKKPMRKIAENLGGLNGFEVGKDGRIYGPLWFKGQAAAVDPATGKIEVVAEGFKVPAAANFDSKGNLWVIDTADGSLYRVDVKTHAKTRVALLSPSLDNLAIDAKDNIYVTNMVDNSVQHVDPKTGAVKIIVKGKIAAAADIAIAHDGDTTLQLADVFSFRQIDTRSGKVTTRLRMFGDEVAYPTGVGVGPKHIVLASNTSSAVQILDRATGKSVSMIHGFKLPVDAAETDNGQILVLELGTGSLVALDDLAGEKRHVVAAGFKGPVAMAVNADHVFVTSSDGVITRVSLGNGSKSVVATGLNKPEGIDVAPDGTLIVAEVGAKRIVAINPDTGKVTDIADNLAIGLPAPEGQGAAFLTTGVAVAKDGTIYVSADLTNAILKIQR